MANLLPEKLLQKIRTEYRERFILAGSGLAVVVALFTILMLAPSYTVLLVTRPAAVMQASLLQQGKQDTADVATAQSVVVSLQPVVAATSSASSAMLEALSQKPKGVTVDGVSYEAGSVSLSGTGDSRDAIDQYRQNLQNDSHFSSVKLPIGDLVGLKDTRFTISLTADF
jgi:Tfp pilus assembly protein PilN